MPSQQPSSQALHEVDCGGVHRQRPQAAVTCQPPVPGTAPVPHSSEGHLTEAAMQCVHVETNCSREGTMCDAPMWLCWDFIFNASPCHQETVITECFWPQNWWCANQLLDNFSKDSDSGRMNKNDYYISVAVPIIAKCPLFNEYCLKCKWTFSGNTLLTFWEICLFAFLLRVR